VKFDNYAQAWNRAHMLAALVNSTIITVVSLVALIIVGSTASYYLARKQSRLSYGMYILFLLGIILPFQLALVPLYRLISDAGLLGTYTSMVLFYTGLQVPFTIFLYTGFLRAMPREYGEAALVDGATHWQSFRRITFPLLRPITGTVIILNAVFIWNDFLTPLIYLGGSANETLHVVAYQFVGQYVSNWGYIFAAVVLATLPMLVLFLLLRRYGIKGFSSGLKA
jgi:raffinose/stachyose/melibiose transport system permease protein